MQSLEKHHFDCECFSDDHTFSFTFDPDEGELYLSAQMHQYRSFFKRVWVGIRYIFGYESKYGHWDCTILDERSTARLKDLCEESLAARKAFAEKHAS
jgi:hypothetical protein